MAWASAEDVQNLTGKVVDDTVVQQATGIIEMTSGGRVASMTTVNVSARNLDWLRRAVAYQAAFMVEYPDYFSRQDVSAMTQDGASATFRADGLVLSPLARRCLKRLSWRGVRTMQAGRTDTLRHIPVSTSDDYDDSLSWRSLG